MHRARRPRRSPRTPSRPPPATSRTTRTSSSTRARASRSSTRRAGRRRRPVPESTSRTRTTSSGSTSTRDRRRRRVGERRAEEAEGGEPVAQGAGAQAGQPQGGARDQGHLHDHQRAERGDREARRVDGRPLRAGKEREGRSDRPWNAHRSRQRRRVPADERELQMAVESLYVEPEKQLTELEWPALECIDVFKIYRSGPVETVALRGLDLRVERDEVVA